MTLKINNHRLCIGEAAEASPAGGSAEATPAEASPTPAEATPAVPDTNMDFEAVETLLNFDPFDETDDPTQTPDAGATPVEPGTKTPEKVEAKDTQEVQPEVETPAVEQTPEQKELQELKDTVASMTQQLQQQQATATAQPQGGQTASPETGPVTPEYQFDIPDGLMSLLDSEDAGERKKGISSLLQGTAKSIHQQVMETVQTQFEAVPQVIQGVIQQQEVSRQIFSDFYEKNPDLNKPELRNLVVGAAGAVMQETGLQTWSETLRNKIAERVRALIGSGQAVSTQTKVPVVPQTPVQIGNGVRPQTPGGQGSEVADIENTLFG